MGGERPPRAAVYRRWPLDLLHLLRLLSSWSKSVEVTVLPPYMPSAAEAADPALYAAGVRRVMAAALGVPAEDCGCAPTKGIRGAVLTPASHPQDHGGCAQLLRREIQGRLQEDKIADGRRRGPCFIPHRSAFRVAS